MIDREHLDSASFVAGQNVVLEQIATGVPLPNVLTNLVQLVEAQVDGMLCSVLLLDEDCTHLRHGAAPSLPQSFIAAVDGLVIGPNSGSCGTAAYFGTPVIVTDVIQDLRCYDYRELAATHGVRATWSTPILSQSAELLGTFAMYYRVPRGPLPEEERLMQVATHIASIAIENRRNQESLRNSEERYRALVSATAQDIWRTNEHGEAFFVTTAWADLTGQSFAEMKGFGWLDAVHAEDRPGCIAAWKKAEQEKCWYENEFRVRSRNGTYRTIECRGVPILRNDGSIREWVGVNSDVTEKKQAEQSLRESNAKIRELAVKLMTAQEEERRHISLELHDDLNQQIAALSIMITHIRRNVPPEAESLKSDLDKVHRFSVGISESIRRLSHELHPPALEQVDLASALRNYVTEFSRIQGIQIKLTAPHATGRTIPPEAAVCLYRVAQESLSNIVKHSGAKTAEVTLSMDDHAVHLEVADSGSGFDLASARHKGGLGLASMEERVRLVSGTLMISAQPGSGARLLATIPLHSNHP